MLTLTDDRPEAVKTVLATVVLVLAAYQVLLIAIGHGRTHRASGDALVVLIVLVAAACAALYGFDGDYLAHGAAGAALVALLAVKIAVVRRGGRLPLPVLGTGVLVLIALTWATAAPEHL